MNGNYLRLLLRVRQLEAENKVLVKEFSQFAHQVLLTDTNLAVEVDWYSRQIPDSWRRIVKEILEEEKRNK